MTSKECCDMLGVSAGATQDEIKKAYRNLAKVHHPDKGGDEEHFKKINEAYGVLSGKRNGDLGGIDFGDLFTGGMPDFGQHFDPFEHIFRRQTQQQQYPQHDREVQINFSVTVEDIKQGRSMVAKFNKSKSCDDCHGAGAKEKNKCANCNGSGQVRQQHRQNGSVWINLSNCAPCFGRGYQLVDPCKKCLGVGQLVSQEQIVIEIKEK